VAQVPTSIGPQSKFIDDFPAGLSFTRDDIHASVKSKLEGQTSTGWDDLRTTLAALKLTPELRWADPAIVKQETEALFTELQGPRPDRLKPKTKPIPKVFSSSLLNIGADSSCAVGSDFLATGQHL
jgi:hypothetical protein